MTVIILNRDHYPYHDSSTLAVIVLIVVFDYHCQLLTVIIFITFIATIIIANAIATITAVVILNNECHLIRICYWLNNGHATLPEVLISGPPLVFINHHY